VIKICLSDPQQLHKLLLFHTGSHERIKFLFPWMEEEEEEEEVLEESISKNSVRTNATALWSLHQPQLEDRKVQVALLIDQTRDLSPLRRV
jgi:hypothetical protein